MKKVLAMLMIIALTGCGTAGGLMSGAGQDLQRAGEWIKKR